MDLLTSPRFSRSLRWFSVAVFCVVAAYYVVDTLHWRMVWDASVMRFIAFMMYAGKRPYSDIPDMNFPGAYLTEGLAMMVFGWSDLAIRIYEYFLLAAFTASGVIIGGRRDWFAGIFASTFFIAMHGADSPLFSTEREEVMAVLLLAALAALVFAERHRVPWLMTLFGFFCGWAICIKPTLILFPLAALIIQFVMLRRRGEPSVRYLLWTLSGILVAALVMVAFFLHFHDFGDFLRTMQRSLPAYRGQNNGSLVHLFSHLTPPPAVPLLLLALLLFWLRRGWQSATTKPGQNASSNYTSDYKRDQSLEYERTLLVLTGAAVGAFNYVIQGKGATYQRYIFVAFLLLWIGLEISRALESRRPALQWLAVASLAAMFFIAVPMYLERMPRLGDHTPSLDSQMPLAMAADLESLGGATQLQNKVFCMDLVRGCLNALYRDRIVENTGWTGDLLLFAPGASAPRTFYRSEFVRLQAADPADVFIIGSEWYGRNFTFAKLDTWPAFESFLAANYMQVTERHPYGPDGVAYRIYLRKGSSILAHEEAHPLPA